MRLTSGLISTLKFTFMAFMSASNSGCFPMETLEEFSGAVIEVTAADTGDAIEGIRISVMKAVYATIGAAPSQTITPCAPTNANGQTFVPIIRTSLVAQEVTMRVAIIGDVVTEIVELKRRDGAMAAGTEFTVRVINSTAMVPVSPTPEIIVGTSPAAVRVNSYALGVAACSCETGVPILSIVAKNGWGAFIESFDLESVPIGFEEFARDGVSVHGSRAPCPFGHEVICPDENAVAIGVFPLFRELVCPDLPCFDRVAFCRDGEGNLVACEN